MGLQLTAADRAMLAGEEGEGVALAMRVLVATAEAMGAGRLLDIESAHVDGCLYHGPSGLDFARALVDGGARVRVPTTLNVSSLDLLHPELVRLDRRTADEAKALMDAYVALGCRPTWTCAPYQLPERPRLGSQIAWGESNAIVFANSVLGARTERYGDFLDICAAVTGRAPEVGLHTDEGRRASLVVRADGLTDALAANEALYPLLGHVLGRVADTRVAAITGLPPSTGEDHLKALGAAAASAGSVAMFHAVGSTPEAPTLDELADLEAVTVTAAMLEQARIELGGADGAEIDAVCVGTPHYSSRELERLRSLLDGRRCRLPLYVNTSRAALDDFGRGPELEACGVRIVTDTCTYITPILAPGTEVVMTDSAKWAYYAPANLGVRVVFGSAKDCVESAVAGEAVITW